MKRFIGIALVLLLLCGVALAEIIPSADSDAWVRVERDTELHAQPDDQSPVLETVPEGSELDYLAKTRDDAWYNVRGQKGVGWIDADAAAVMWSTLY